MPDGERVVFEGEGDENPEHAAGDVVFVLNTLPHATFVRDGVDLKIKRRISLREALLGFEFTLKHLDGVDIVVKREGVVTQPGKCTFGLGRLYMFVLLLCIFFMFILLNSHLDLNAFRRSYPGGQGRRHANS